MVSKGMRGFLFACCLCASTRMGRVIGEGRNEPGVEPLEEPNNGLPLLGKFLKRGSVRGVWGKADRSRGVPFIAPCGRRTEVRLELNVVGCVVEEPLAANGVTKSVVWQWRRECRAGVLYAVIVWDLEVSKVSLRCAGRATVLQLFVRSSRSTRDVSEGIRAHVTAARVMSLFSLVRHSRLCSSSNYLLSCLQTHLTLRWLPSLRDHDTGHLE